MESRGNDITYTGQYVESLFPTFRLKTPFRLQRNQRRSRIAQLGSLTVVERRLQDLWLVGNAAIHLRRRLPHLYPRMGPEVPVR